MKITVIGGGNMGGAIARGAISQNVVVASNVIVSDPSEAIQASFKSFNPEVKLSSDNKSAVKDADLIVVAVKPWLMETVLTDISSAINPEKQMIVSIAAGITFESIAGFLALEKLPAMFRIIPNTAITLGESTTFVCHKGASAEQIQIVLNLFATLGKVFEVQENQMTALTALASCGIAYIFKYIDAAVKGGQEMGVEKSMAQQIVMQTVKGALTMLAHNNTEPQTEIDKVTTPGGITLKGLEKMEECGFTNAVIEGLKASK